MEYTKKINKTYIINLKRCYIKKAHMENELDQIKNQGIDINPCFFEAVDGQCLNTLKYHFDVADWHDLSTGKAMTKGEVGCALSHYLIWCNIVELVEKYELPSNGNFLILEDDIMFMKDFHKNIEKCFCELNFHYDMLYLHRKPLDAENELFITENIIKPNKSYWACAYIMTYNGAKKLIKSNYINNLIPVDDFLPIMYGCQVMGFEKKYEDCEKISCFAVKPYLFDLLDSAFVQSETYHSTSFLSSATDSYQENNFTIIYFGPTGGHSYERFLSYCKLYKINVIIPETEEKHYLKSAIDIINLWSRDKICTTLVLIIMSKQVDTFCSIVPLASPKEIIEKFQTMTQSTNDIIISSKTKSLIQPTNKILICTWANSLLELWKNYHDMDSENLLSDYEEEYLIKMTTILAIESLIKGNIVCDESNEFFYCVNNNTIFDNSFDHVSMRFINLDTDTTPYFIYSNEMISMGPIENYTGSGWKKNYGFTLTNNLLNIDLPSIYASIKGDYNINFFGKINYPKNLLTVNIMGSSQDSFDQYTYHNDIKKFLTTECQYYFYVDNNIIINNLDILIELLKCEKDVVAPMIICKNDKAWSNFWGDIKKNGYYKRSFDYLNIINYEKKGCWNVPYITNIYLIKRNIIEKYPNLFIENNNLEIDMRMCYHFRQNDIFMYVSNMVHFGYFNFRTENDISNENDTEMSIFDLFKKKEKWEEKYLHPKYYKYKTNLQSLPTEELCNDIYNFPLFSQAFCAEIIKCAESYGVWSKGNNEHSDPRLGKEYYENFPTVDVQLFELGLEKHWKEIVFSYIAPMARLLYSNYKTKDINLAFVVKYDTDNQVSLSPHHDSSTYTVNISLNRGGGIDYDGGGCRFIRQNYILQNKELGMCTMHPGRLTAYHEGLPVTAGTRYILVSFIN